MGFGLMLAASRCPGVWLQLFLDDLGFGECLPACIPAHPSQAGAGCCWVRAGVTSEYRPYSHSLKEYFYCQRA